jgi:hypothetical protein
VSFDRRLRFHVELGPIVHTHIWRELGKPDEVLCLKCMDLRAVHRLGRMLMLDDLRPCRWNLMGRPHSWFDLFMEREGAPPSNLNAWRSVGEPPARWCREGKL